ncbi:MAG: TadE/TadG family type IV pilus assembly protein [Pseudomonadota bacterium]
MFKSTSFKTRVVRGAKNESGVAAVEFALIATPMFILIFGLLELCMVFLFSAMLEHGTNEAARLIRTGQVQNANLEKDAFKTAVCDELYDLFDCENSLHVDVQSVSNFASANSLDPLDTDRNVDPTVFTFQPGGAGDIILVRTFYEWDLITPVLSLPLSNMNGQKRLVSTTEALRNEPFGN